jgi:N,N'-diacetyllegionaminate synthase
MPANESSRFSSMAHTEIIAECGINHNGDWLQGLDLIDAAKRCGVDTVKFQLFSAARLKRPELEPLELNITAMNALKAHCEEVDIRFLCTPFDVESLWELVSIGVNRLKISSGCITNEKMLEAAKKTKLPIIMSTGMCTHDQMWAAYIRLGHPTILQCTSAYPTPFEEVNLRVLDNLPPPYGLSDHTQGIYIPIAAVGRGATVIEKHFTLDSTAKGPDHSSSLEPPDFEEMVIAIRQVEKALGNGQKQPMPSEKEVMKLWR